MNFIYSNQISLPEVYEKTSGNITFTSLITSERNYVFLEDHLKRFALGVNYIRNKLALKSFDNLENEINGFLFKNFKPNSYFRLIYMNENIYYSINAHSPKPRVLNAILSTKDRKLSSLSFLKDGNYKESFNEVNFANSLGFDDVLFSDGNILFEASTSNIILVSKDKLLVSNYGINVFEGIFEKKLVEYLKTDHKIERRDLKIGDLLNAKEIWLTNCVQGMRFIEYLKIEDRDLKFEINNSLYLKVINIFSRFGESTNE